MSSNFDEILGAAGGAGGKKRKQPQQRSPAEDVATPKPTAKAKPASSPFAGLEPAAREPTVRLNVDVKESLNDALAAKAKQYRIPKTELVRRILEWAIEQQFE